MKAEKKKTAFTIIELLTVMSIIVILISLLVPALNSVRRYSKVVRQNGQFHNLKTGLEMYKIDFGDYPDSNAIDVDGNPYCGAMKLCEAMMGQDGLGFNPNSRFASNGIGQDGVTQCYYNKTGSPRPVPPYTNVQLTNLRSRKLYVEETIKSVALTNIYSNLGIFPDPNAMVIMDCFGQVTDRVSHKRIGMPILYYKANTTGITNDYTQITNGTNIYNYLDNQDLLKILPPGVTTSDGSQPLWGSSTGSSLFYDVIKNNNVTTISKPYNTDSYILISAGWDGLYGTKDDVFNFVAP